MNYRDIQRDKADGIRQRQAIAFRLIVLLSAVLLFGALALATCVARPAHPAHGQVGQDPDVTPTLIEPSVEIFGTPTWLPIVPGVARTRRGA